LALDPAYYTKFTIELEKLTKVPTKNQFSCNWDLISTVLENAVGNDGRVKQAQNYFSQKSSGCENKNVLEAIWQIRSNYREFNELTDETFTDDDGIERSTLIGHRMRMYDIIFKEVLMSLTEGSEFKSWLEKQVASLRRYAKKSIEQFIAEIEAKIDEKEWGSTVEKLKVLSKETLTLLLAL